MRILFVTGEFPPMQGGVGDCTHELARALAACGVEAHVLTNAAASPSTCSGAIRVHPLVRRWDWGAIPTIGAIIRDTRPDIVHIQYQTAAFGMNPAVNLAPRLLRRTPFVTTFHDIKVPYLFPKAGPARQWITAELARASAAVVATNSEDYRALAQQVDGRASLIPIGSNIAPAPPAGYEREAWRSRLGVQPGSLLLSYFGFLNDSKGGETLVRALELLPEARLLMIGGRVGASDPTNAAYLGRVQELVAELGLDARVIWTDFAPPQEVSANLLASDICVLPYRDGASFRRGSFMAALAHGLPIVTTMLPAGPGPKTRTEKGGADSLPELVDGANVLLVPPDDSAALASAIARLRADVSLQARLKQGALGLASHFTWDKIAARHLHLYQRLLTGSR